MSISLSGLAQTLVINDETGEWILTSSIIRVTDNCQGSSIYLRSDTSRVICMSSPLSPKELRERLFLAYTD